MDIGEQCRATPMLNKAMERKIHVGEALDLSPYRVTPPISTMVTHVLPADFAQHIEGKDLCDLKTEEWIWSVGRHKATGEIHASTANVLYEHPQYECLWLR